MPAHPIATTRNVPWAPRPNTVTAHLGADVPEPWTSAVGLVLRPAPHGPELLLVDVRGRGLDVPGGHRDPGEDIRATVVRELAEETGLHLDDTTPVTVLGYQHLHVTAPKPDGYAYPHPDSYGPITVIQVPTGTEPGGTSVPDEIAGHRWLPIPEVAAACEPRTWLPFLTHLPETILIRPIGHT